jgi:GGDEF domain-containing protein
LHIKYGDEFVILMPNKNGQEAKEYAELILEKVRNKKN